MESLLRSNLSTFTDYHSEYHDFHSAAFPLTAAVTFTVHSILDMRVKYESRWIEIKKCYVSAFVKNSRDSGLKQFKHYLKKKMI